MEIEGMSVKDRLELAGRLWQSAQADEQWDDSVPLWHREILEERLKESLQHPELMVSLEDVLTALKTLKKNA
jgi:hypothetical protein